MARVGWKLKIGILLLFGMLAGWGSPSSSLGQKPFQELGPETGKSFYYTAKRFGIPILKAFIKIENGSSSQGKLVYQIHASIDSLPYLKFLFRMNNRFCSTIEAESFSPLRYVKEINQEGVLTKNKNYLQILTFDHLNKRVIMEHQGERENKEISLPPGTYDPLSMFAKYYLKEELYPGQDIHLSIFDGVKLRSMVFYSRKGKVKSKIYGEVEAVCLESSTSFSSFEDKEGSIRIWYTHNGEKTPILIELGLPIGHIKFELESMERS